MASIADFIKGAFVSDLPEPAYVSIQHKATSGIEYEVRRYSESQWMQVRPPHKGFQEAIEWGVETFKNYFDGENEARTRVECTQPILLQVHKRESYVLCPLVDPKAPLPLNKSIVVEKKPAFVVFVMQFDGFADNDKWKQNMSKFGGALGVNKEPVKEFFSCAQYDAKQKLIGRRNEIWFEKNEQQKKTSEDKQVTDAAKLSQPKKVVHLKSTEPAKDTKTKKKSAFGKSLG